jgi:uncharacterized membrane protein HdeD (DUF308 family)
MDQNEVESELEDADERTRFTLARIDLALLTSPVVLRAVGGIAVGLALLTWPNRSDRVVGCLIGIALVVMAVTALRSLGRNDPRRWLTVAAAVVTTAVGVMLVVDPDQSTLFGGRLLGIFLVGASVYGTLIILRGERRDLGRLAFQALVFASGVLLMVLTDDVIDIVTVTGASGWILVSIVVVVASLDASTAGVVGYADTTQLISAWLRSSTFAAFTLPTGRGIGSRSTSPEYGLTGRVR